VVEGKVWPKPANAKRLTEKFKIYRYDPDGESDPRVDTFLSIAMVVARWCLDGVMLKIKNRKLIRR